GRPRCRPKGWVTRSLVPARCSVQIGRTRSIDEMLQVSRTDSQLPAAVTGSARADTDPQTTNLEVRNSNLFGAPVKSALLATPPYLIWDPNKVNKAIAAVHKIFLLRVLELRLRRLHAATAAMEAVAMSMIFEFKQMEQSNAFIGAVKERFGLGGLGPFNDANE